VSRRPAILTPIEFERVGDGIRARLRATVDGDEVVYIAARLTRSGVIWDLQCQAPGNRWTPGTTGSEQLDRLVTAALEREFSTGCNAMVVSELTSPRQRRRRRWYS
jgi:hypothetical protein